MMGGWVDVTTSRWVVGRNNGCKDVMMGNGGWNDGWMDECGCTHWVDGIAMIINQYINSPTCLVLHLKTELHIYIYIYINIYILHTNDSCITVSDQTNKEVSVDSTRSPRYKISATFTPTYLRLHIDLEGSRVKGQGHWIVASTHAYLWINHVGQQTTFKHWRFDDVRAISM